MKLVHIKDEVCPTCGSDVISETSRNVHSNGQHFETREFRCGLELRWIPNYSRLEFSKQCPNHPDEVAKLSKRALALAQVHGCIDRQDVDANFKERLKDSLPRLMALKPHSN